MSKKRRQDIWNEESEARNKVLGIETEQFVNNIAANTEGVSADYEKYPIDKTTTPKLFNSSKRDSTIHKGK
ncbi:MAG TPA: hypothetical protein VNT57_05225 [Desulfobacteria bacterium]|nr:hypothetical protein [Desulfobacteria bacterium]